MATYQADVEEYKEQDQLHLQHMFELRQKKQLEVLTQLQQLQELDQQLMHSWMGSDTPQQTLDSQATHSEQLGVPIVRSSDWLVDHTMMHQGFEWYQQPIQLSLCDYLTTASQQQEDHADFGQTSEDMFDRKDNQPFGKSVRRAKKAFVALGKLLNYYFEPFNFQHNKLLLDLTNKRCEKPKQARAFLSEQLFLDLFFTIQDFMELPRIGNFVKTLQSMNFEVGPPKFKGMCVGPDSARKLYLRRGQAVIEELELHHLEWRGDSLVLQQPPEVRRWIGARHCDSSLLQKCELCFSAKPAWTSEEEPSEKLSILTLPFVPDWIRYAGDQSQTNGKLKRQVLLYSADVVCIQGIDLEVTEAGKHLLFSLLEEAYDFITSSEKDCEVFSIFWKQARWMLLRPHEFKGGVSVDLRFRAEVNSKPIRVVNMASQVTDQLSIKTSRSLLFSPLNEDRLCGLVVCADLSSIGGADAYSFVEDLAMLKSLAREVLDEEIRMPDIRIGPSFGLFWPMSVSTVSSSGLNRLTSPNCILFSGLEPICMLSGHSNQYLSTVTSEDFSRTFPSLRIPLMGCFNWKEVFYQ